MSLIMGKGYDRGGGISEDGARYYPPELITFALCAACLGIVLKQNVQAKKIYDEIKECWLLPGCQETFYRLESQIPEGEALLKDIVKKSGLDFKKPPSQESLGIPYIRSMFKGAKDLASGYVDRNFPWVWKNKGRKRDFEILVLKLNEFIKMGFNNAKEQYRGKYKITAFTSRNLFLTIWMCSLVETQRFRLKDWERLKIIKIGNKTYDIGEITYDEVTRRIHSNLVKQYKNSGWLLKHDYVLDQKAWRWYQSRVVCSGPEEYCRKLQLEGETINSANLSNEIRECDEALGYLRINTSNESEPPKLNKVEYVLFIPLAMLIVFIGKIKTKFKK